MWKCAQSAMCRGVYPAVSGADVEILDGHFYLFPFVFCLQWIWEEKYCKDLQSLSSVSELIADY